MLSIIIPVFNGEKTLVGLLDSIRRSDFKDYEIIVVDDFSSDRTVSIIRDYNVKGVFLSNHSGPAVARNKGAEIARGETLVFFDSDIEVEPDTLGKIAKRFKEDQNIKVLVGAYSDKPLNKGYFPMFKALWCESLYKDGDIQTASLEGFCTAIDKEVFKSAGGFDPSFKTSGIEDYELGCRLRQKYKLYLDTNIQVRHNFSGFLRNGMRFFRRSSDFTTLFLNQDRTSRGYIFNKDGFVSLSSFMSCLLLPFVVMRSSVATFLFLFFMMAFIFFGRRFIKTAFYEKGLLFTLASILTYYINGIILSLGIITGVLRYLLKRHY